MFPAYTKETHKRRTDYIVSARLISFLLMVLGSYLIAHSQQIRNLGQDVGLNGRQTFNVVQDKKGFIWISTRYGVDRYDGESIKNYPMDILYNGIIPIRVTRVVLDRDSTLWAYTDRGTIYKYNEQRDEFVSEKDVKCYLRNLYFDHGNNIWLGARTYFGLLEKDSTEAIAYPFLKNEEIQSIQEYNAQNLLIVTNRNLYKFNISSKQSELIIDSKIFSDTNSLIESCFVDQTQDELWFGLQNNGLFIYKVKENKVRQIQEPQLMYHPILTISPYKNDYLLLGTEGMGMCVLNKKTNKIEEVYNNRSDKDHRINGNAIYGIYKDKDERIWLSSFSSGVNILDFSEYGFKTLTHEENNSNSLIHNTVCDILEDTDRNLWFATSNGLSIWNRKNNSWKTLLHSKNVINLFEDSRGEIWVAVYSSGIYVLNKQGQILRQYMQQTNNDKSLSTNFVYTITEDKEGNIWVGGKKGNVSKYDRKNNSFRQIPVSQANYIMQWGDSKMLISSEYGVYVSTLDMKSTKACAFNQSLKSYFISDMYLESDSIVWLATYGNGINRCNLINGEVRCFTTSEGLQSNIINSFLFDDKNNIWFSSENRIGKFNIKTFEVINYSKGEGVYGKSFRQLAREKTSDGLFFFGSYEGAVYFNPDDADFGTSSAKISFQEFKLFNQVIKPGDNDSPLSLAIDNTSDIKLNYRQHSFSLDFTAIDFFTRENRQFMWKLEGLDKTWVGPRKEHIANYTNLPPGSYQFRVKYLDDNNRILDRRNINILITPPFWETTWFRIIQLILAICLAWSIYWYVKQRYRKKQSEEKIKFFINTAHDIRTPLTLISSPLYELKEEIANTPKNDYLLKLITDNLDKLNKMFTQLLDFQKSYEMKDQLVVNEKNVNKYLRQKMMYWKSAAQKKHLHIALSVPDVEIIEWFDVEKMDRILDNLVSNALKYSHDNGEVRVVLVSELNFWKISVIDNGIGISKSDKAHLFQRFYRASNAMNSQESGSGLGLILVKNYVTLHKGNIQVTSVENKGSEFCIQFQHGKDHYEDTITVDSNNLPIVDEKTIDDEQQNIDKLKIKVMIVEDNNDLRTYMELSLSHYYHIYTAKDGLEAWNSITKINPDIVVSDLQMPGMDGFSLCEKIKNTFETSHIPVIMLTIINDKEHVAKGFNLGVDDYIEKPFDFQYLRIKIDNIIQNRKILRLKFLGIDKSSTEENILENEFNSEFIKKATDIIEENLSDAGFSITDFSKEMGLSRTLLYNKFNAITGYTPNDFIKIVRMKNAILYFREKKYPINEVALMVGFEEAAYFSTCFKKIYGKTPKQFIEENIE